MSTKEFKVNDFITLRLEEGYTHIYVAEERFSQCVFLLLNIPVDKVSSFDEIDSVDEAAAKLDRIMEEPWNTDIVIPPEVEFWAHCSNMQVWAEHNYDTRLIHSNLAFPLLKRLTEAGDPVANAVFKEEIAKRLASGYKPTIQYLLEEEYTKFLTREEFYSVFLGTDEQSAREIESLVDLENQLERTLDIEDKVDPEGNKSVVIENNRVVGLGISYNVRTVPKSIGNLKFLKELVIYGFLEQIPFSIEKLESLELLDLSGNSLTAFPKGLDTLGALRVLKVGGNEFDTVPASIGDLNSLEVLNLGSLKLKFLPDSIGNLTRLKVLGLGGNQLTSLPETIGNLQSLEELYLNNNNLVAFPNSIEQLKSLKVLNLNNNNLSELPENLGKLMLLEKLELFYNNLQDLPNSILKLKNLKELSVLKNKVPQNSILIQKLKEKNVKVYV